jgi:hypothetical protein
MIKLDVSLKNSALYSGCEITEVAGRLNLTTPMAEAVNIVGHNVNDMELAGDEITLTGAMAIPIYCVVFHAVVHRFTKVWYDDGRGGQPVLLAQHGA